MKVKHFLTNNCNYVICLGIQCPQALVLIGEIDLKQTNKKSHRTGKWPKHAWPRAGLLQGDGRQSPS